MATEMDEGGEAGDRADPRNRGLRPYALPGKTDRGRNNHRKGFPRMFSHYRQSRRIPPGDLEPNRECFGRHRRGGTLNIRVAITHERRNGSPPLSNGLLIRLTVCGRLCLKPGALIGRQVTGIPR